MVGNSLGTSMQFDTFGDTAAEMARRQFEKEQNQRPSAIPGPAPDELIVPATDPIGVRLMLKMGWRRGQSIKSSKINANSDARREARKAFLALSEDVKAHAPDSKDAEDAIETAAELPIDDISQLPKSTPELQELQELDPQYAKERRSWMSPQDQCVESSKQSMSRSVSPDDPLIIGTTNRNPNKGDKNMDLDYGGNSRNTKSENYVYMSSRFINL